MKILALSDLHGDRILAKEMAKVAEENKVDFVILAGDLVGSDGTTEGIVGPFKEKGLEIGLIPGNHEGLAEIDFMAKKYNVKNLHGYILKKDGIGIFGCGYGNIGPFTLNEEEVFKTLEKGNDSLKDVTKKIMITHTHPKDSVFGLGIFPGSEGIKKALDEFQPDIHICGHIHETEGIEEVVGKTRVINVGRKGKIIEL